jgi:exonuclease I
MTLQDWLKQNFAHVTLDTTIMGANGTLLSVPKLNVDLTIGIISTNNKEEFAKLAFHYAPLGTIIEPLEDDWYETRVLLVRNLLTEKLLKDQRARHYLDILSRRDKEHWQDTSKQKEVKVESKSQDIHISISEF